MGIGIPRITEGLLTVPCCWATVHGPPDDCTCDRRDRLDEIEERLAKLERRIRTGDGGTT